MSIYILNNDERKCSKNPYDIDWKKRKTIQKRLDSKKSKLSKVDISKMANDLVLIPEDKRENLIFQLLNSVDSEIRIRLINNVLSSINKDEEYLNKLKYIKESLKNIEAKSLTYYETNLFYKKSKKDLENKNFLKKTLEKIYNSENFILYRKISEDKIFIFKYKQRSDVWWYIINNPKKITLLKLIKKFPKSRYAIEEFYTRGILLSSDRSVKEFVNICKEKIYKNDYRIISKYRYLIYSFKFPSDLSKTVKLNPVYYNKIFSKGEANSYSYFGMFELLRNLLTDNPLLYNNLP